MNLLDEVLHACIPIGRVGRAAALLACVLWVGWIVAACGPATGTPAEQQAAKYESDLTDAIAALGAGRALDAERFAFALTLLDESRCEGHAALGASLAMQKKPEEGAACLGRAKAQVGGSVPLLVDLIAYASGAGAAPAARSDGEGTAKWESTLAEAFAALVSGDAVKAERLAYAATRLEEGRCEIEAVRGAALMKLSRPVEAKAAFESAVRQATGPEVGLLRVLEAVLGAADSEPRVKAKPAEAPPVVPQEWCDVLVAAPDPAVVTDADGRARMMATGLPWKVRDRKTGIVMLLCPPGEFMMGSPLSDPQWELDEALHRVTMTEAFYLSETEVTQESWQKLMDANPSRFTGSGKPVEEISWDDCQKFCKAAGLRLPSESEWEYACRAGTVTTYSFGASVTDQQANFGQDMGGRGTAPCGSMPANPWGFREMHGNVWEWCEDGYHAEASKVQAAATRGQSLRIVRGGSWDTGIGNLRSASRHSGASSSSSSSIGLRVARAPEVQSVVHAPQGEAIAGGQGWFDVVAWLPDAAVVTDTDGRRRMAATGLPWKVRDRKTGVVMLLCPPGEFMMGSAENAEERFADETYQRVSITAAFYMSETEVTQSQWQSLMGSSPSSFPGDEHPVEGVSWMDCKAFCTKSGFRLPSEAEWEYACRAGTTGVYAGDLDSLAWYNRNSGRQTHPVRQKRANPWGLHDMHGNVWEWCEDAYMSSGSDTHAPRSEANAPHSVRGGSWYTDAPSCRSANRSGMNPTIVSFGLGFRVARTHG